MSSSSQARDIDDVLPGTTPDELLSTLHDPDIYWGPTYKKPLRGRPFDELEILQKSNCTGICNLCDHVLVRRGYEWGCVEPSCRVEHPMFGCVPRRGGWGDDDEETSVAKDNDQGEDQDVAIYPDV